MRSWLAASDNQFPASLTVLQLSQMLIVMPFRHNATRLESKQRGIADRMSAVLCIIS